MNISPVLPSFFCPADASVLLVIRSKSLPLLNFELLHIRWGGIACTNFVADSANRLSMVMYSQCVDYWLCAPGLRAEFQRAVYNTFPDLRAKLPRHEGTGADTGGQEANMVFTEF